MFEKLEDAYDYDDSCGNSDYDSDRSTDEVEYDSIRDIMYDNRLN